MPRARLIGPLEPHPLDGAWALAHLPAGSATEPAALEAAAPDWIGCDGPMTAAAAVQDGGRLGVGTPDFDAVDWWYRCRFEGSAGGEGARIRFEGLATVADVWLNGVHQLHSDNMYLTHEISGQGIRPGPNELLLRFHALAPLLAAKRPRPRWKTRLVTSQQLRWHRTTLLGRIQEWCPPIAPVGPWREVFLVPDASLRVGGRLDASLDGDDGIVEVALELQTDAGSIENVMLHVAGAEAALRLEPMADGAIAGGVVRVVGPDKWWPHTHGSQALHEVRLTATVAGRTLEFDLGQVGFRSLEVDRGSDGQGFGLRINGVNVFCRGACWTPLDIRRLRSEREAYRTALLQARQAGMNMLRVSGTTVYEHDDFYDLCDELGILVWQDFMFANMDYPWSDPAFASSAVAEARQFLDRMQGRPCLAVLCGGSEVEQQAAMVGRPEADWRDPAATTALAGCCSELAPGVPWVSSSPSGGTLPFQVDKGVGHYYGVGAYRRPFEDARRAGVRFASECLAFSNVPEAEAGSLIRADTGTAGVPRDPGSDWTFETVRDHYVGLLFAVDPAEVRFRDPEHYLDLGRIATGEAMARVVGEWRRSGSSCRGALVWFLRDFAPGAGWGVVDSSGHPKPAWWALRRAFAPLAIFPSDEGVNGLDYHIVNDSAAPVEGDLSVSVYRDGEVPVASATTPVRIPARGSVSLRADGLFPGFLDLTGAYRFGPPGHNLIVARLLNSAGDLLGQAFYWPREIPVEPARGTELCATARPACDGYVLTLRSSRAAIGVSIETPGFDPDDNWFQLEPGVSRTVRLRPTSSGKRFAGTVRTLDGGVAREIQVPA